MKAIASRAGVSLTELKRRTAKGQKWCYKCKEFLDAKSCFISDSSRYDGFSPICRECKNRINRERYKPKARIRFGPLPDAPRSGDKIQARQRINVQIRTGRRLHPNFLPCEDCGHVWKEGERRHEYDHYLGYGVRNHYNVQAVCTTCHRKRSTARGEATSRARNNKGRFARN